VPAGRLLAKDDSRIVGFGRNQYDIPGAHVGVDAEGVWGPIGRGLDRWTFYRLFATTLEDGDASPSRSEAAEQPTGAEDVNWSRAVPVLAQALVLAKDTLFLAGPKDRLDRVPYEPSEVDDLAAALETSRGGRLLALSLADGQILADHPLESSPVFDGMAAVAGRLYVATKAGQVVCLAAE